MNSASCNRLFMCMCPLPSQKLKIGVKMTLGGKRIHSASAAQQRAEAAAGAFFLARIAGSAMKITVNKLQSVFNFMRAILPLRQGNAHTPKPISPATAPFYFQANVVIFAHAVCDMRETNLPLSFPTVLLLGISGDKGGS